MSQKSPQNRKATASGDAMTVNLMFGEFLSIRRLRPYLIMLATAVIFGIIYVAQKYRSQTSMETIQHLRTELNEVRSVAIEQRSMYMSAIRESNITRRADSMHLGLALQERPPYVLTPEEK